MFVAVEPAHDEELGVAGKVKLRHRNARFPRHGHAEVFVDRQAWKFVSATLDDQLGGSRGEAGILPLGHQHLGLYAGDTGAQDVAIHQLDEQVFRAIPGENLAAPFAWKALAFQ